MNFTISTLRQGQPKRTLAHRWTVTLALATLGLSLTGCFRVSRDLQAMRDAVFKSSAAEWHEEIELGVGSITLTAARTGLGFLELPPEARCVLGAARSAEVGVYRVSQSPARLDRHAALRAADRAMSKEGWDRVVGVVNDDCYVAVYVPAKIHSSRTLHVCVAVMEGTKLVLASARTNIEPLLELALSRAGEANIQGVASRL